MAVFDWIYGNATLPADAGDYRIRLCGEELNTYTDFLTQLSIRLLSVENRAGREEQICWFAGRLEDSLYLVAAGGTQKTVLGPDFPPLPGGYRQQFCVLGLGFSGDAEIARYAEQIQNRDTEMFRPLKTYLWELSHGQQPPRWSGRRSQAQRRPGSVPPDQGPNLFASSPERNDALWAGWRTRSAALDILTVADARKMIALMPGLVVTTLEDVSDRFYSPGASGVLSGSQLKELAQKAVQESQGQRTAESPLLQKGPPDSQCRSGQASRRPAPKSSGRGGGRNKLLPSKPSGETGLVERRRRISDTAEMCRSKLDADRAAIAEECIQALQNQIPEKAYLTDLIAKWSWMYLYLAGSENIENETLRGNLEKVIRHHLIKDRKDMAENLETLLDKCDKMVEIVQKSKEE